MTSKPDTPATPNATETLTYNRRGEEKNWRRRAAIAITRLEIADGTEDRALADLSMALREGLTPEQQRRVAQDLLGEPHVSMITFRERPGAPRVPVTVLVPASQARDIASGWLIPDPADPWWNGH